MANRTVVGESVVGRLFGLHKRLPIVVAMGVESLAEERNNHYRYEERQQLTAVFFRQIHSYLLCVLRRKSSENFNK